MTDLYVDDALSAVPTQGGAKVLLEQLRDVVAELLGGSAGTTLTIAGGIVTPTRATHSIDTEAAAAADDLDTIVQTNHPESRLLLLRGANAGRVPTVRHNIGGAGKILLTDGAPFVLNSTKKWLLLIRVGTTWEEVARFYGDRLEEMRAWLQVEPDTVSTNADRNITNADRCKVLTLTGAVDHSFTYTATPAQLGDGWTVYAKNASTAFLTILPASGTIDGKFSLVLKPGEIVEMRSDGANIEIIGGRLLWRERLTANRTYYQRIDGNDANTGLVNSAGGAFLTKQKFADTVRDTLDLNGFVVTLQIVDSAAYTDAVIVEGFCVGQRGISSIVFQGNNATPGNVVINTTSNSCFSARRGAMFSVKDMELRTTTSGNCLSSITTGQIGVSGVRFGTAAGRHMWTWGTGSWIIGTGNYSIVGGATQHYGAYVNSTIDMEGITVTLVGTPAFSSEFAHAESAANIFCTATFSGTATGKKHEVLKNGIADTSGGGVNFFPGSIAGTTATGGQFA